MNHSAKKQTHEQARKKHRHQQEAHARELARQKPKMTAFWVLAVGMALLVTFVLATVFF